MGEYDIFTPATIGGGYRRLDIVRELRQAKRQPVYRQYANEQQLCPFDEQRLVSQCRRRLAGRAGWTEH